MRTLRGHTGQVEAVAFSPDGTQIVSASGDKTLKVWKAATGQARHTLSSHTREVYGVAFSPDGTRIVSASKDRTLKIWDTASGQDMPTL
ncbi:MAG: hypothetical protein C3F13_18000, partial [Anaerolineales bacterium]